MAEGVIACTNCAGEWLLEVGSCYFALKENGYGCCFK